MTTTTTLETREARLNALLNDVTDFSGTARSFLDDNGDNLIRLGEVSRAQLRVLARYSTEFPCLLGGIVNAGKLQAEAFRGFTLHIVLETLPNQPRGYSRRRRAACSATTAVRPACTCPARPGSQANPVRRQPDFDDGVDTPTGKGTSRTGTSYDAADAARAASAATPARRRSPTCSPPCSRPTSAPPRPRSRTSAGCCSARWSAAPPSRSGDADGGETP